MDKFYELVTGEKDAFFKMCMVLPSIIEEVVNGQSNNLVPKDTAIDELKYIARHNGIEDENMSLAMAVYLLGFGTYMGFK